MPLVLELRMATSIPLEVDALRLERVVTQPADDVARTLVGYGNGDVALGEFFHVSGSAAEDETIVWKGDCSRVKRIAAGLSRGFVRIEGNAGMHLGAGMSGGEILVDGDVDDWLGAEMKGGRIHVRGNAGHLVGAVYRGGRRGMTGGEILVDGNAGNEIGHTMRRGLISIGGNAGDAIGAGMIAGTVLVFGIAGCRAGAGMKRGTIGLLSAEPFEQLLPTFHYSCTYCPSFLALYLSHLRELDFPVPGDVDVSSYRRFCGDLLELGKGEILTRST